jgi:hypothetical protein
MNIESIRDEKVKKLAETLRSSGLAASDSEAIRMATDMSSTADKVQTSYNSQKSSYQEPDTSSTTQDKDVFEKATSVKQEFNTEDSELTPTTSNIDVDKIFGAQKDIIDSSYGSKTVSEMAGQSDGGNVDSQTSDSLSSKQSSAWTSEDGPNEVNTSPATMNQTQNPETGEIKTQPSSQVKSSQNDDVQTTPNNNSQKDHNDDFSMAGSEDFTKNPVQENQGNKESPSLNENLAKTGDQTADDLNPISQEKQDEKNSQEDLRPPSAPFNSEQNPKPDVERQVQDSQQPQQQSQQGQGVDEPEMFKEDDFETEKTREIEAKKKAEEEKAKEREKMAESKIDLSDVFNFGKR